MELPEALTSDLRLFENLDEAQELGVLGFGFGLTSQAGVRIGKVWQLRHHGELPTLSNLKLQVAEAQHELDGPLLSIDAYTRTKRDQGLQDIWHEPSSEVVEWMASRWRDQAAILIRQRSGRETLVFTLTLNFESGRIIEDRWVVAERDSQLPEFFGVHDMIHQPLIDAGEWPTSVSCSIWADGFDLQSKTEPAKMYSSLVSQIMDFWSQHRQFWKYQPWQDVP